MTDIGALLQISGGYRRNPALVPIGRMYAFESKVSDWRQASAQALRYAQWADAVGIVLLNAPRDVEGLKSYARSLRLGFAIGSRWLVRPVLQPASRGMRLLSSETFVSTIIE